jgi:hypothetical protein
MYKVSRRGDNGKNQEWTCCKMSRQCLVHSIAYAGMPTLQRCQHRVVLPLPCRLWPLSLSRCVHDRPDVETT